MCLNSESAKICGPQVLLVLLPVLSITAIALLYALAIANPDGEVAAETQPLNKTSWRIEAGEAN